MDAAPMTLSDALGWGAALYIVTVLAILAASVAIVWMTGRDPS